MWPEKATTAKQASKLFLKKMAENPDLWAENMAFSVENLTDELEQCTFLRWCADPMNKTNMKKDKIEMVSTENSVGFENNPKFFITERIPGRIETVRVNYVPQNCEDEKSPL